MSTMCLFLNKRSVGTGWVLSRRDDVVERGSIFESAPGQLRQRVLCARILAYMWASS